jgi:hypothetical protein
MEGLRILLQPLVHVLRPIFMAPESLTHSRAVCNLEVLWGNPLVLNKSGRPSFGTNLLLGWVALDLRLVSFVTPVLLNPGRFNLDDLHLSARHQEFSIGQRFGFIRTQAVKKFCASYYIVVNNAGEVHGETLRLQERKYNS